MSDWSKADIEKMPDELKALFESAKKGRDRAIEASVLYNKIEEVITAHNMTHKDCIEILKIVAPLFDCLENPNDAKESLRRAIQTIIAVFRL